mmetsp:Transcript_211/g.671  ORF Transcript_211/g.671 Transcript_211/m.671 type:complete len:439 (+) Transcript_211:108-1424(+)
MVNTRRTTFDVPRENKTDIEEASARAKSSRRRTKKSETSEDGPSPVTKEAKQRQPRSAKDQLSGPEDASQVAKIPGRKPLSDGSHEEAVEAEPAAARSRKGRAKKAARAEPNSAEKAAVREAHEEKAGQAEVAGNIPAGEEMDKDADRGEKEQIEPGYEQTDAKGISPSLQKKSARGGRKRRSASKADYDFSENERKDTSNFAASKQDEEPPTPVNPAESSARNKKSRKAEAKKQSQPEHDNDNGSNPLQATTHSKQVVQNTSIGNTEQQQRGVDVLASTRQADELSDADGDEAPLEISLSRGHRIAKEREEREKEGARALAMSRSKRKAKPEGNVAEGPSTDLLRRLKAKQELKEKEKERATAAKQKKKIVAPASKLRASPIQRDGFKVAVLDDEVKRPAETSDAALGFLHRHVRGDRHQRVPVLNTMRHSTSALYR